MIIQVADCFIGRTGRRPEDLVEPGRIWVVKTTNKETYLIRDVDLPIVPGQLLNIVRHRNKDGLSSGLHRIKR